MEKPKIIISFFAVFFVILLVGFSLAKKNHFGRQENKISISKVTAPEISAPQVKSHGPGFGVLWFTDFNNNRVVGFTPEGKVVWNQNMSSSPIPRSSWYFIGGIENVTLAPDGNLITVHGDGMMVQELDRQTHNLVWQYGRAGIQTYRGGVLDEPDKSYKINDHEVLINDGNDREVLVVDQNTNQVVWKYGEYHKMGSTPGLFMGNTSVRPIGDGSQFLVTDTLQKKIILIDRASKNIVWEYEKPDAKWLQNVFATKNGTFVLEDRQKGEIFEVDRSGKILWMLDRLSDEDKISYPTDTAKLDNGNVIIAEAGRGRIVEVVPETGEVVREYLIHGLATTIALDPNNFDGSKAEETDDSGELSGKKTITVSDTPIPKSGGSGPALGSSSETVTGEVADTNPSTGRAGGITLKRGGGLFAVQVYNYSSVVNKNGAPMSLMSIQIKDKLTITGTISGGFIQAQRVQDNSR